jgi:hypothetical protein
MNCAMCGRPLTRAAAISAAGPVGPVCAAKAGLPLLGDAKPPAHEKTRHKARNAPLGRRVVGEWIEENQLTLEM